MLGIAGLQVEAVEAEMTIVMCGGNRKFCGWSASGRRAAARQGRHGMARDGLLAILNIAASQRRSKRFGDDCTKIGLREIRPTYVQRVLRRR